jgi:predicted nucleic acid-binding protein
MSQTYVLDASAIIDILRKNRTVGKQLSNKLDSGSRILLCPVVYYETLRGLLNRQAQGQARFFSNLATTLVYEEFERRDWDEAAVQWDNLRQQGHHSNDADLLIGVYAYRRKAILVTSNEKDFIPLEINIENWRSD